MVWKFEILPDAHYNIEVLVEPVHVNEWFLIDIDSIFCH